MFEEPTGSGLLLRNNVYQPKRFFIGESTSDHEGNTDPLEKDRSELWVHRRHHFGIDCPDPYGGDEVRERIDRVAEAVGVEFGDPNPHQGQLTAFGCNHSDQAAA